MENWLAELIENQSELEIFQYGVVPTGEISISEGVRDLCKANACGCYNKTWACPPGVGTLEECSKAIHQYAHMLVFTTKHCLEDSFDYEGMMDGKAKHEEICERVMSLIQEHTSQKMLVLSAEGCMRCTKCTYPEEPCRFPDKLYPSVESYGIEVNKLANSAKVNYINGANTLTYFAGICY